MPKGRLNRHQHTIPQFYLRSFLVPGWVYRRGHNEPRLVQNSENVAARRDYYGKDTAGRATLDTLNKNIEDAAAPAFKKLLADPKEITTDDWELLSVLFANLFIRNPALIEEWRRALIGVTEKAEELKRRAPGLHEAILIIGDLSNFRPELAADPPYY